MSETAQGQYETPADAGNDQRGAVRLWLDAITLARKTEEPWRKNADKAVERYRDENGGTARRFNILYANTQILLPSLYNSTPKPDVRRRHGDADPVGKVAAQVLERGTAYALDVYDFDEVMRACVLDMVLPGRGIARVRYDAKMSAEKLAAQDVTCEHVDWGDFIVGPGRKWSEVPWIGFVHRMTREQLIEQFGAIGRTMQMDVVVNKTMSDKHPREVPDVFKRATVYEIWDKQAREVLFLAETVADRLLRQVPDPLRLGEFWPVPRPLYDVADSGSLVPLVPYDLYRGQAEELDRVTQRINALVSMCRYRGLRDASLQEIRQLAEAKDGDFIPVENAMQYLGATGGGGLERAMWITPIETIARVIVQLEQHRESVKATIYEITGLSDILRGATQASETATAQQIKFQSGSLRIQDRQREVQRFARDLVRLQAEIIAENFEPAQLATMTGMQLPTPEMKAMAQQAMQAAQPGQPPPQLPPEMQRMLSQPTWDEVMRVLRSDAMRGYRVDIETDSTIQQDVARQQQNAGQFVQGFGGFMQAVGPAVLSGAMPMDVATDLLTSFARSFKLGRQAEDALERMGQEARQPKPQGDDGSAAAAQAEQHRAMMEAQAKQAEMQQAAAMKQAELQQAAAIKAAEIEAKQRAEAERLAFEREKMAFDQEMAARKADLEEERMLLDARNKDADRQAARGDTGEDAEVEDAVKQSVLEATMAQIAETLAALQQGQAATLAAVQAPKRAIPIRGADGMITEVTMAPVVMN
jgi:hypothetical protein